MAKRRTSAFEDIVEIASRLPWWVGLLLAVVAYSIFHQVAGMDTAPPKDMAAMGDTLGRRSTRRSRDFCNTSFLSLASSVRHCRSWRDGKGESCSPASQRSPHQTH